MRNRLSEPNNHNFWPLCWPEVDGSFNRFFCCFDKFRRGNTPCASGICQTTRQHLVWNFGGQRQFMCLRYISMSCVVGQFYQYWCDNCPDVRQKSVCNLANGQFSFRNGIYYPNFWHVKRFHGNFGELLSASYVNCPIYL